MPTTLSRWHRDGLIPTPEVKRLGRGKGSISLYPQGVGQQTLEICRLKAQIHSLEDIGFILWLYGFSVGPKFSREYLKKSAIELDRIIGVLHEGRNKLYSEDDNISEPAWDELQTLSGKRISSKLARKLRKRVGSENFDAALLVLVDIATGNFRGFADAKHDAFMRAMMGTKKINLNIFDGLMRWLKDSIEEPLINLSNLISEAPFIDQLDKEMDQSLREVSVEFRQLFFGLSAFAEAISKHMNIKLPAFFAFHEFIKYAKPSDLALIFLVWHRMRRAEWASGYTKILDALRATKGFSMVPSHDA